MPETQISLLVDIPESLHNAVLSFLDSRPDWDQDQLITAALALFVMQNTGNRNPEISRIYLDSLFKRPVEAL